MPASKLSSVDLPEPLGPINAKKSPASSSRSTRSNATISKPSRVKRLLTLRTCTIGAAIKFSTLQLLNLYSIPVTQILNSSNRYGFVDAQTIQNVIGVTLLLY